MNIRQHQLALRDATVVRQRGNSRLVVRDGKITTVHRRDFWDERVIRWAGLAGTGFGWGVSFGAGFVVAVVIGSLIVRVLHG